MEKKENIDAEGAPSPKIAQLKSYIAALLMLVPTLQVQSWANPTEQQEQIVSSYQEKKSSVENVEYMVSYETIFKDGIKKTLNDLNDINQIPVWWKTITYYRDSGNLKGKAITPESVKALELPDKFDISPRVVNSPVESMVLILWNRNFDISPDICNIKNIYLTTEELVIETTLFFDITYDKQEKLPDLLFRLWKTPKGKWEKEWFRATTVTEI